MRICKSDIVGARIVDLHATYEEENDLEFYQVLFTVDRGFTFTLPLAGFAWDSDEIPSTAKRLESSGWLGRLRLVRDPIREIKQRVIAGIFCLPPHNAGITIPDSCIVLDDGSQVWNYMVAPSGTGGVSLCHYNPSECPRPTEQLVDYFSIPIEESELT